MITQKDLQEAIAECEGQRNPNANTCMKLAAFYTIRDNLYPEEKEENFPQYSRSAYPIEEKIEYNSKSEFANVIYNMDINDVMEIMDELMTTLQIINPRLYDGVIQKLSDKN